MLFSLDNDIQDQEHTNRAKAIGLGFFLILSLGVAAFGITRAATYSSQEDTIIQDKKLPVKESAYESPVVTKEDHARGVGELQNVLIEYSDFQCPICAPYARMVSEVEKEFRGKLTVVYRNFPKDTIHQNAHLAARAVQAATEQGKFWQMHDLLYEKQSEWSVHDYPRDVILQYAKVLLLDTKKFSEDMDAQKTEESIEKDIESGKSAGVDTVPAFFLNGKKIASPRTVEEFKETISRELKNNK